jgi:hypothetical protein
MKDAEAGGRQVAGERVGHACDRDGGKPAAVTVTSPEWSGAVGPGNIAAGGAGTITVSGL